MNSVGAAFGAVAFFLAPFVGATQTPSPAMKERLLRPDGSLSRILYALASVGAVLVAMVVCAPAQSLNARIQRLENDGVRVGVCALTIDPAIAGGVGRAVFSRRQAELFIPASNQKILTAVAVLEELGADFEFETRIAVRDGTLYLQAAGDPNWRTGGRFDPVALFESVGAQLRQAGVATLRGVELDDSAFAGPSRPKGWPAADLAYPYCAPASGFALDANCFRVDLRPGGDGVAAVDVLAPELPMEVRGQIRLTKDRERGGRYEVTNDGLSLRLGGHLLRSARPRVVEGVLSDPVGAVGAIVRMGLQRSGIRFATEAPARSVALAPIRTPLRPALHEMLKESSNFHAEQLLRALALAKRSEGTVAAGREVLRATLDKIVEQPRGAAQIDGSGLSRINTVSPATIASLLCHVAASRNGAMFLEAMPRAGFDGTLAERFETSPLRGVVRAKTGWIRGASSLSGVVRTRRDELRAFSILMNYDPAVRGLNKRLKAEQERIVEALAEL